MAGLRIALGIGWILAPGVVGAGWLGPTARKPAARVMGRAIGARDLGLAAGLLLALRGETPAAHWLGASASVSAADLLATLTAQSRVPGGRRVLAIALAGATAGLSAYGARSVDAAPDG